jgi:formylglycine-generating enzyme required for sulfatase activity
VLEGIKLWLSNFVTDLVAQSPIKQIDWIVSKWATVTAILAAIGAAIVWLRRSLSHKRQDGNHHGVAQSVGLKLGSAEPNFVPQSFHSEYRWEYQWEIGDSVLPRAVEPSLSGAIVAEVRRAAAGGKPNYLIFVRGELGIGKTTLAQTLLHALKTEARLIATEHLQIANFVETAIVSEADDLQPAQEFSRVIGEFLDAGGAVIALARPGTLAVVERRLGRSPDATVVMLPFEPARPLFHECITTIVVKYGLNDANARKVHEIASRFDQRFLQTPFYFEQVALAVASDATIQTDGSSTPLQIFVTAIQKRLYDSGVTFSELVECALDGIPSETLNVPGIISEGNFIHDGYRNVVLAAAFVTEDRDFISVIKCQNAIPAVRIILSHLRSSRRPQDDPLPFEAELRQFAIEGSQVENQFYPIYIRGLIADTYRQLKDEEPAEVLRRYCIELILDRNSGKGLADDSSVWWDVSDALSAVGDPRLRQAQHQKYGPASGYFTHFATTAVEIGTSFIPKRTDNAKPVLPFKRTRVSVGPFWVANYLVTNETFLEFWDHPERDSFFRATGGQWLRREPALIRQIEAAFDTSASRCFWKELVEQEAVAVSGIRSEGRSPLDLARKKALRAEEMVPLWDPVQADDRFSARGKPVVGVNWWEAMAFCDWWTRHKLPNSGFPLGCRANLLTDWEWEAIRRLCYDPLDLPDLDAYPTNRHPAHTRTATASFTGARIGNVMRPLHVGLVPSPYGSGPTDMVGNVWEWTRSRVFGKIAISEQTSGDFGKTVWLDGDQTNEQTPLALGRDVVDDNYDLSYRSVRGGSFFSRDEQAAWHPAYRLCDPPFDSFIDLGFRFAIYPPISPACRDDV